MFAIISPFNCVRCSKFHKQYVVFWTKLLVAKRVLGCLVSVKEVDASNATSPTLAADE